MPTRFMTDPHEMRSMTGRFDVHAQTVGAETDFVERRLDWQQRR